MIRDDFITEARHNAYVWARNLLSIPASHWIILDTETTGLDESAEVIQITGRSFRLRGHQSDKNNALPGESDSKPATSKTGQTRTPGQAEKNTRKPNK